MTTTVEGLDLALLPGRFAVGRLAADQPLPADPGGVLFALSRSADELSVLAEEGRTPPGARVESGLRALRVAGPLDFSLTGILAALTAPLAEAGVPIFALSTYDTDYLLVPERALAQAVNALESAGHRVHG